MPIYEYRCDVCGHEFEKIVRVSQDSPPCPRCEAATQKKISLSAFHLKGGGWYADGYGSKGGAAGGSEPATASGAKDAPATTSSDATTPAKAESKAAAPAASTPSAPAASTSSGTT